MFGAPSRYGTAQARYRDIDAAARVHSASPHTLITIMFDELLRALDTLCAAERLVGHPQQAAVQARAVSILHGLEAALDYPRGGEIAVNLGRIYREGRRLISTSGAGRGQSLSQAKQMIGDIAGAWVDIGE